MTVTQDWKCGQKFEVGRTGICFRASFADSDPYPDPQGDA